MSTHDEQEQAPYPTRHEDDEFFDRIEVTTAPRYKESHLSGDEWRTSARIALYRKGVLVREEHTQNLQTAAARLPWLMRTALEDLPGEEYQHVEKAVQDRCAQPGCADPAVVRYRLLRTFCREGHESEPYRPLQIQFCLAHARRGDCGLQDADANYAPADEQTRELASEHGLCRVEKRDGAQGTTAPLTAVALED